ncbi:MAG: hydroxyethylthiazole kinase, partial [Candidatus Micrarchaeia archaeon]
MTVNATENFIKINQQKPLVHHLTNWVTIYDCAQITRLFGALPVMAHAKEEVEQMTRISSALVLNIGTLTKDFVDAMILAGKAANEKNTPVILDCVGVGATTLRTNEAKRLLKEVKFSVIKGNAGEIGTLSGAEAEVKGVESINVKGDKKELAKALAKAENSAVAITGEQDVVASHEGLVYLVDNGSKWMGKVVGTGCMAASVIGCFTAVEKNSAKAAAAALSAFG